VASVVQTVLVLLPRLWIPTYFLGQMSKPVKLSNGLGKSRLQKRSCSGEDSPEVLIPFHRGLNIPRPMKAVKSFVTPKHDFYSAACLAWQPILTQFWYHPEHNYYEEPHIHSSGCARPQR